MKRSFKNLQIIAIFMIIWIILNENVGVFTLISGVTISILTLKYTNILLKIDYAEEFYVPFIGFFVYCCSMIKEIYTSAYVMIKRIFKRDITPTFIEYESDLSEEFFLVLLANSITLPPGSVTVARHENKLTILSANPNEKEMHQEVEAFEKKLKSFEKNPARRKSVKRYNRELKKS